MQPIVHISLQFLPLTKPLRFQNFYRRDVDLGKAAFPEKIDENDWRMVLAEDNNFTENLLVWRIIEAICGMSTGNRFVLITYSHEGLCTLKSKVGFSRRLIEVRACTVGPDTPMPVPSTILAEKAGPSFLSRTRYVDRADFWPWIPVRCRVPVVLGVIVGGFYCARRKDILEISYMIRE